MLLLKALSICISPFLPVMFIQKNTHICDHCGHHKSMDIVSRLPIDAMPGIKFECCLVLDLNAGPTPIAVLNADL